MAGQQFNPGDRVVDLKRLRVGTVRQCDSGVFYLVRFDELAVNRWVDARVLSKPLMDSDAACVEAFRAGASIPELYRRFGRRLVDDLLIRIKRAA